MNLTPHQKRQLNLVLVLLVGIPATVFLVYKGIQLIANASSDATPTDVLISNLTSSSVTVSWVTEKKTDGYVVPILNGVEQSPVPDTKGDDKWTSHYVELVSLEPSTEYSFIILSDAKKFKKDSTSEYEFTTAPVSEVPISPNAAFGSVLGDNQGDTILYIVFADKSSYPISEMVPQSGNWSIDLSAFRDIDNMTSLEVTDKTKLVVIAKNGINKGAVLEGELNTLFDNDKKLIENLTLEDVEAGELIEYFPDIANLGMSEEVVEPTPPVEPTPTPQEPVTPTVPIIPTEYVVRQDIRWESLVGSSGSASLESGEDTVTISNLSDTYVTISWRSAEKEEGYVKYGTSKTEMVDEMIDSRDTLAEKGEYYSHHIESERLEPDTTYYFEIYSGEEVYDNDGAKYTIGTFTTLSSAPPLETRVGKLINTLDLSDWVLIGKIIDNDELGTSGNSGFVSVVPDTNGTWEIVIGDVRSEDGSSYFSFSDADILQIYVLGSESDKYDFNLSLDEIELDMSKLGGETTGKVGLLTDYGILN